MGEESPSWPGQDEIRNRHPRAWTGVVHSLRLLEETFNLSVPESEIAFMVQFLLET
ncbi:PRD domain-containing protein [Acididesulfobacillus acetoxydans]|uniref:PRD domain-containing protein n=1 Tax=Acididesulfobacillus acetoxydans TaxID=1561005 RepID=UPI003B84A6D7